MKRFQFAKLVRDRIPEHLGSDGQVIEGKKILDDEAFIQELRKKVIEEATELAAAPTAEEMKEELADVQEVLECLQRALGMTNEEMVAYQQKKIAKNGAFEDRVYIEAVSVEEGSKWGQYYTERPEKYPEAKK
jgi:predicted house-cleaning noncanonical NTP pyrophosphatase (MazG superfamily)